MCGICGYIGIDEDGLLESMTDALLHRGPDNAGYFRENGVGLGHRRLSIIDLHSGHQPISNEDETIWVVLNGEIYNYVELRKPACLPSLIRVPCRPPCRPPSREGLEPRSAPSKISWTGFPACENCLLILVQSSKLIKYKSPSVPPLKRGI